LIVRALLAAVVLEAIALAGVLWAVHRSVGDARRGARRAAGRQQ
jgi:hypothetical protein